MELPKDVRWNFLEKRKAEKGGNPVQKIFFERDGVSVVPKIVESLVRESIQNSLDAKLPNKTLEVTFRLQNEKKSIKGGELSSVMSGLKPHVESKESSVELMPEWDKAIPSLTVEDFNTTGLEGDVKIDMVPADYEGKNDFCNFWRNLTGFTAKNNSERGKWGLGKAVFPASSQIASFFGATIRPKDENLYLMGLSVLNTHRLESDPGKIFLPYGDFGVFNEPNDPDFVLPIIDKSFNKDFLKLFGSERVKKGTGFSVFIPYPLDDFKSEFIILSVLQQYYYAILKGDVIVTVYDNGKIVVLSKDTILEVLDDVVNPAPGIIDDAIWHNEIVNLKDILSFATWICQLDEDAFIPLKELPSKNVPMWSSYLYDDIDFKPLRTSFGSSERLAFKVPIWVKKGDDESKLCHFKVFVSSSSDYGEYLNEFIRQDLTIPEIRGIQKRGFKGFVIIDKGIDDIDEPLVTMVGLSENPAHTTWGSNQDKFKKANYQFGDQSLSFIKNSLRSIYSQLQEVIGDKDDTLLSDLFPLESLDDDIIDLPPTVPLDPVDPDPDPDSDPPIPPDFVSNPPKLLVNKVVGGFKVSKHPSYDGFLNGFSIAVGYRRRGGNAIKGYHPNDFDLQTNIAVSIVGVRMITSSSNKSEFIVLDQAFKVKYIGFDENRDLVIDAKVQV